MNLLNIYDFHHVFLTSFLLIQYKLRTSSVCDFHHSFVTSSLLIETSSSVLCSQPPILRIVLP
jgi:hypothetical protein